MGKPVVYLSTQEAAAFLGLTRDGFYKRTPPEPDVLVGATKGWSKETLTAWDATVDKKTGPKVGSKRNISKKED